TGFGIRDSGFRGSCALGLSPGCKAESAPGTPGVGAESSRDGNGPEYAVAPGLQTSVPRSLGFATTRVDMTREIGGAVRTGPRIPNPESRILNMIRPN